MLVYPHTVTTAKYKGVDKVKITNLFGEEREVGVGEATTEVTLPVTPCRCGCGAFIQWRGYGRKPHYLNKAHGERYRRKARGEYQIGIPNDVSRQKCLALLEYLRGDYDETDTSTTNTPLENYALEFLVNSPAPVEDTLLALKKALAWLGAS